MAAFGISNDSPFECVVSRNILIALREKTVERNRRPECDQFTQRQGGKPVTGRNQRSDRHPRTRLHSKQCVLADGFAGETVKPSGGHEPSAARSCDRSLSPFLPLPFLLPSLSLALFLLLYRSDKLFSVTLGDPGRGRTEAGGRGKKFRRYRGVAHGEITR